MFVAIKRALEDMLGVVSILALALGWVVSMCYATYLVFTITCIGSLLVPMVWVFTTLVVVHLWEEKHGNSSQR